MGVPLDGEGVCEWVEADSFLSVTVLTAVTKCLAETTWKGETVFWLVVSEGSVHVLEYRIMPERDHGRETSLMAARKQRELELQKGTRATNSYRSKQILKSPMD